MRSGQVLRFKRSESRAKRIRGTPHLRKGGWGGGGVWHGGDGWGADVGRGAAEGAGGGEEVVSHRSGCGEGVGICTCISVDGGDVLRATLSLELGAEMDSLMTRWAVRNCEKVCTTVEGDDKVAASHR